METYIRTVKYDDINNLLEDEFNENPIFLVQIFLTQNIEDIGIYDDLPDNKINIGTVGPVNQTIDR